MLRRDGLVPSDSLAFPVLEGRGDEPRIIADSSVRPGMRFEERMN